MNLYRGNTGERRYVPEAAAEPPRRPSSLPPAEEEAPPPGSDRRPPPGPGAGSPTGAEKPPGPLHNLMGGLGGVLSRLDPGRLETEDLLVLAILWLLYRESGDRELLIALGAYLFL